MDKTQAEMEKRFSQLKGVREQAALSLAQAAEFDAIRNHGLAGWNDYLRKRRARGHRG